MVGPGESEVVADNTTKRRELINFRSKNRRSKGRLE